MAADRQSPVARRQSPARPARPAQRAGKEPLAACPDAAEPCPSDSRAGEAEISAADMLKTSFGGGSDTARAFAARAGQLDAIVRGSSGASSYATVAAATAPPGADSAAPSHEQRPESSGAVLECRLSEALTTIAELESNSAAFAARVGTLEAALASAEADNRGLRAKVTALDSLLEERDVEIVELRDAIGGLEGELEYATGADRSAHDITVDAIGTASVCMYFRAGLISAGLKPHAPLEVDTLRLTDGELLAKWVAAPIDMARLTISAGMAALLAKASRTREHCDAAVAAYDAAKAAGVADAAARDAARQTVRALTSADSDADEVRVTYRGTASPPCSYSPQGRRGVHLAAPSPDAGWPEWARFHSAEVQAATDVLRGAGLRLAAAYSPDASEGDLTPPSRAAPGHPNYQPGYLLAKARRVRLIHAAVPDSVPADAARRAVHADVAAGRDAAPNAAWHAAAGGGAAARAGGAAGAGRAGAGAAGPSHAGGGSGAGRGGDEPGGGSRDPDSNAGADGHGPSGSDSGADPPPPGGGGGGPPGGPGGDGGPGGGPDGGPPPPPGGPGGGPDPPGGPPSGGSGGPGGGPDPPPPGGAPGGSPDGDPAGGGSGGGGPGGDPVPGGGGTFMQPGDSTVLPGLCKPSIPKLPTFKGVSDTRDKLKGLREIANWVQLAQLRAQLQGFTGKSAITWTVTHLEGEASSWHRTWPLRQSCSSFPTLLRGLAHRFVGNRPFQMLATDLRSRTLRDFRTYDKFKSWFEDTVAAMQFFAEEEPGSMYADNVLIDTLLAALQDTLYAEGVLFDPDTKLKPMVLDRAMLLLDDRHRVLQVRGQEHGRKRPGDPLPAQPNQPRRTTQQDSPGGARRASEGPGGGSRGGGRGGRDGGRGGGGRGGGRGGRGGRGSAGGRGGGPATAPTGLPPASVQASWSKVARQQFNADPAKVKSAWSVAMATAQTEPSLPPLEIFERVVRGRCGRCNAPGHFARDCKQRLDGTLHHAGSAN